jgi:branched-chain amino acid transport system substrate-binding protein
MEMLRFVRIAIGAVIACSSATTVAIAPLHAQGAQPVNIGMLAPLSGPYAENGFLMKIGTEMAVEEINAQGGIKALGGAKLNLVTADTGATLETATNAAQRILGTGNISGFLCCWASSFGLAGSEIGERLKVPMLTYSFADELTSRGYKYIFRDSPMSTMQMKVLMPLLVEQAKSLGKTIKTAALVGDNSAVTASYFRSVREELPKYGITIATNKVWTPPLTDALPVALATKSANADIVFLGSTTLDDSISIVRAFHITKMSTPAIGNGAQFLTPEFLKALGPEKVEGLLTIQSSAITKDPFAADFLKRFRERTKIDWTTHNTTSAYAEVWILKEAIEKAASPDPLKVRDALASLRITTPPPTAFDGKDIKFDETGQYAGAPTFMVQWQDGRPVLVTPSDVAVAPLKWK